MYHTANKTKPTFSPFPKPTAIQKQDIISPPQNLPTGPIAWKKTLPEKAYGSHAEKAPWKLWLVKSKPPPRNSLKNRFSLGFGEFWDFFFFFWVLLVGTLEMFVIRLEIPLLLGLFLSWCFWKNWKWYMLWVFVEMIMGLSQMEMFWQ